MEWKYEENHIFSVDNNNEIIAEINYSSINNTTINITHVYVNPECRGQGLAETTMLILVNYLRIHHKKAVASCSYANTWLQKNKEQYQDIIA